MAKNAFKAFGWLAFVIGIFGAIIFGLMEGLGIYSAPAMFSIVLAIAGLIIGLMNIQLKERMIFMVAGLVILGSSVAFALIPGISGLLQAIFKYLAIVTAPAIAVVALMAIYKVASK